MRRDGWPLRKNSRDSRPLGSLAYSSGTPLWEERSDLYPPKGRGLARRRSAREGAMSKRGFARRAGAWIVVGAAIVAAASCAGRDRASAQAEGADASA